MHSSVRLGWLAAAAGLAGAVACGDDATRDHLLNAPGSLDGSIDAGLREAGLFDAWIVGPDGSLTCPPPEEMTVPLTPPFAHITGPIDYPDPPPAGGNHNPCWGAWGVHDRELADELWVHNLEHGGVVYLYNCPDGCPDEIETMAEFVFGQTQALLTPYSELPTRFGVVAWGVRLLTNCFDEATFRRFYVEHVNMGPEKIASPPSADCL